MSVSHAVAYDSMNICLQTCHLSARDYQIVLLWFAIILLLYWQMWSLSTWRPTVWKWLALLSWLTNCMLFVSVTTQSSSLLITIHTTDTEHSQVGYCSYNVIRVYHYVHRGWSGVHGSEHSSSPALLWAREIDALSTSSFGSGKRFPHPHGHNNHYFWCFHLDP